MNLTSQQRAAVIEIAMRAATDSEWGYESDEALAALLEIDADYDWAPELLQAELETDRRRMGPMPPSRFTEIDRLVVAECLSLLERRLSFASEFTGPMVGSTVRVRVPERHKGTA